MSEKNDPKTVALAYLAAMGRKDLAALSALLAPDVAFRGPAATLRGQADVSAAYRRATALVVRNDLTKVFVDGPDVCLLYDFVTDTPGGAVPTMEWLNVQQGKIASIVLLTDHVRWPLVLEEAKRRAAAA